MQEPFRLQGLGPQQPSRSLRCNPTGSTMSGRLLFPALELWAEQLCGPGTPHSSGETPQRRYRSQFLNQHTVGTACLFHSPTLGKLSLTLSCGSFPLRQLPPGHAHQCLGGLEGPCANLYSPLCSSPILVLFLRTPCHWM